MNWGFCITLTLIGLLLGSFINVVIHRGPAMWALVEGQSRGNLVHPRSYCPSCRTQIRNRHLLPVVSYVVLRGKCAACAAPIPLRYPLAELAGAASGLAAAALFGATPAAGFALAFFLLLTALAVIDLETGFLPDALTIPLLIAGALANAFGLFASPLDAAIGALAGYGAFAGVAFAFRKLRGRDGIGLGDAKLLAGLGAWLGWAALPFIVFVSAMLALGAVLALRLAGRAIDGATPVPFGPALAAAGAAALIARGLGVPFSAY